MEHIRQSIEELRALDATELLTLLFEVSEDAEQSKYALHNDVIQDGSEMHNTLMREMYELHNYMSLITEVAMERNLIK